MSLPERISARRAGLLAVALAALVLVGGCTVRPLYMNAPTSSPTGEPYGAELASIAVKPVTTRQAQEVRNHLIFLFGGGRGEPASPRYTLDIGVSSSAEQSAFIQVGKDNEPTAALLVMRSSYRLFGSDGEVVASGNRQITSSFDVPRQEFAVQRARRDAEDRAARELAELIRLAVVQDLAKLPAQ